MRRVVITGLGIVSPIGNNAAEVTESLRTGRSGIVFSPEYAERGFRSVDVVSIAPDNPNREEMRRKFLDEHFHKEDEVRFFVAGSG